MTRLPVQEPGNPLPLVSIVIVAFNDIDVLRKCLASIEAGSYRRFRVVVVDNSLTDAVEKGLAPESGAIYLRAPGNIGFSRGCNLGIADSLAAGADFIWLLNPDTEVDPECLAELVRCARERPDAGIVGGRIRYMADPDRIWYAGGELSRFAAVGRHRKYGGDPPNGIETVTYATGCCMLIPEGLLRRLGPLEKRIFMYLDDAEFCMRVLAAGYRIYYVPSASLSHAVGPGMDFRQYPDYYLYFSIRNKPLVARSGAYQTYLHLYALSLGAAKLLVYGLRPGVRDRRNKLRAIFFGTWDSLSSEARERIRFPRLFQPRT